MHMNEHKIFEAFDEIKADQALKQKTRNAVYAETAHRRFPLRAVLTACVMLIAAVIGIFSYTLPVYAISMDDSSSVELHVNIYDRVVSVDWYDSQAASGVNSSTLTNMNYQDAVAEILSEQTADQNIIITVAGQSQSGCQKMINAMQNCASQCMRRATYRTADSSTLADAHQCGLSMGKYNAYLKLKALDPSITIEQVKEMTMQEIHQKIADCDGMNGRMMQGQ